MNNKNNYIRDYLGITAWHAAGYTGGRVHALTGERLEGPYAKDHGQWTKNAFFEIAPNATLTYAPCPTASNTAPEFENLCGDACVMFVSLSVDGGNGATYADPVIPNDLFLCVGAGNDGESSHNGIMHADKIYGVGAVDLVWSAMRNGEPLPGAELLIQSASYTSESEYVDFGSATGLYLDGYIGRFTGTSCAAPTLAGMAALVNDFFIDKTGRPLTHKSMYNFFKDYSVDIEAAGKDETTGWGIPILPDPSTIDIWKYQQLIPTPEKETPIAPPEAIPPIEEPEENPPVVEEIPPAQGEGDFTLPGDILELPTFTYETFVDYMHRYEQENYKTLAEIIKNFFHKLKIWYNN